MNEVNGIMNEMNSLIASVMEKLPEIRSVQEQMKNPTEWNGLSDEQRETISSRHEENEHEVKRALPLCNKTLKMLGFLSTDNDIRSLFLLEEMCPRLVNMLLHVMTKLVGARGMELKVYTRSCNVLLFSLDILFHSTIITPLFCAFNCRWTILKVITSAPERC